ncbi:MAG: hypothetical protein HP492_03030 [Nitrospira sp.]|nr:hypothetical protein [Nitrospira sp.]
MVWDPKDPWSKRSDPLEDALKQAQSQFKNLFPSGGLNNLLPSGGARNLILAALLIFLAWQSVFIVSPDEEGVVKRFGTPVRTVEPGPHFKIPVIESVLQPKVAKLHRVEVGFRTSQQGRQQMVPQEALMLTGDMNILAIEFIVQYKIKESSEYLFNVADIHETIGKAAEASMREVVGKSKIDEALTTGKADIQQSMMVSLQSILDDYHAGVQVAAVQLQDVDPPEAVAAAFKDVTNAVGSYVGGLRVTKVLAENVTTMNHTEGLSANLATSSLVLLSGILGLPVSTTHVSSSAIIGIGLRNGMQAVRWPTVQSLVLAWIVTLPATAVLAGLLYWILSMAF